MTRLKTIFLALIACMLLYTQHLSAQSSSCIGRINMSVNADCTFTLGLENLKVTGPALDAQSIRFEGVNQVFVLESGLFTSSLMDINLPAGGTRQYRLYGTPDGRGSMLCWGEVNFEIKSTPEPIITTHNVMCGQPLPHLLTVADLLDDINDLCSAPITDLVESREVFGESCDGFRTIRKISGQVEYAGGRKAVLPFVIDTIIEMPLIVDDITCPIGGPNKEDAIILFCDDIGNVYPTPAVVEEYAPDGLLAAYPYIDKGSDTTITMTQQIVEIRDTVEEKVLVTDDAGQTYWVITDVIDKRDTVMLLPDTTITEIVISLKDGPTCNLSAKYTDQAYPGCAGLDSKILREWTILDWCNGSVKNCVQWIIVETDGPQIEPVDDQFVAIAPWTCQSSIQLSAKVDQGCSETLTVIYQTSVGSIDENNILTGLWLGEAAMVEVIAIDDCGQRALDTFYVTPIDSIAPVAIAADQVNLSLSGDPLVYEEGADRGVGKVYVDAIDAGSHNTGCGEVSKCILLKEELDNPVIIDGEHAMVDGQLMYHAAGCTYDGILPGRAATKFLPEVPEIKYVVCKDFVKFCCESIGNNEVAMQVRNSSDRVAMTWTNVLVEDKSSSIVICPEPITVGCNEEYEIPRPIIYESICATQPLEMTMTENFDNCGDGVKTITWTRGGEVVCVSEIFVDGSSGFNPYEIKWPRHYDGDVVPGIRRECELLVDADGEPILDDNGNEQQVIVEYDDDIIMGEPFECSAGGLTGEPIWCQASCGLIGVNFEDQTLDGVEACSKIIRRWTLIDWCMYEANTGNDDDENDTSTDSFTAVDDEWLGEGDWLTDSRNTEGATCRVCDKSAGDSEEIYFRYDTVDIDGYYTFDQVIKIIDFDDPVVTAPDTITLSITGGATAKGGDFDDCVAVGEVTASAEDFCGADELSTRTARWFVQVFRLDDGNEVLLNTVNETGSNLTVSTMTGQSGDVHKIRWVVRDGCGNNGVKETYILFVEDKKPTPLCTQVLSTSTMSTDGTATIWATDYDAGSFDNCSEVDLFFKDRDGNYAASLTFTCDDIEDGIRQTFDMDLYAVDALGNFDYCTVSLRVDDFSNNCPDNNITGETDAMVSGAIATQFGAMVEDVQVQLDAYSYDMTDVEGKYAFDNINNSYAELVPTKDNDYDNGITTIDLVKIQRHIIGLDRLDNPYSIIAADVNNDARVSALDLVDLRKFLLGIYEGFPRNKSWRFVDAAQQFEDPESPFPFNETIRLDQINTPMSSQNFMAVKIGDVNGSAIANSALASDTRSVGALMIAFSEAQVSKGDVIEVEVSSDNFQEIIAYQYTMDITGLQLQDVAAGAIEMNMANFGQIDASTVTTSWYSPVAVTTNEVLYTMTFLATEDVMISDAIQVSSRVTDAVAYNDAEESLSISTMYMSTSTEVSEFALLQNTPNPFDQQTEIQFYLPTADEATLTVMDLTGRVLYQQTQSYEAGSNVIRLSASQLNSSGVMYYQLESGEYIATKKMIMIGSR